MIGKGYEGVPHDVDRPVSSPHLKEDEEPANGEARLGRLKEA